MVGPVALSLRQSERSAYVDLALSATERMRDLPKRVAFASVVISSELNSSSRNFAALGESLLVLVFAHS
jgi:hypothetical protein